MQITIDLTPQARAVLARVQAFPQKLGAALVAALDYENELTVGEIQRTRLSRRGPDTLGVVTNRLRSSVSRAPARLGSDGRSVLSAIGSNVEYAAIHEFGLRGPVPVRAHSRRTFTTVTRGGEAVFDEKSGRIKKSRKKQVREQSGVAQVKGHTRQVNVPARAPFRRGIEARTAAYSRSLSRAILRAWDGQAPA